MRTYDNIRKIAADQRDDYATGCLLDYPYFKENYKLIAINLSKQEAFDVDPKAMHQINLTGNLNWGRNADGQNINANTTLFSVIEEAKEKILDFSKGTVKML